MLTFNGHDKAVRCVCLDSEDRFLFSGSMDSTLKMWDVSEFEQDFTRECVKTFAGHEAHILDVKITKDDKFVFTASGDKTAMMWNIATGQVVSNLFIYNIEVSNVQKKGS